MSLNLAVLRKVLPNKHNIYPAKYLLRIYQSGSNLTIANSFALPKASIIFDFNIGFLYNRNTSNAGLHPARFMFC